MEDRIQWSSAVFCKADTPTQARSTQVFHYGIGGASAGDHCALDRSIVSVVAGGPKDDVSANRVFNG